VPVEKDHIIAKTEGERDSFTPVSGMENRQSRD
jgi:hypothetical protein